MSCYLKTDNTSVDETSTSTNDLNVRERNDTSASLLLNKNNVECKSESCESLGSEIKEALAFFSFNDNILNDEAKCKSDVLWNALEQSKQNEQRRKDTIDLLVSENLVMHFQNINSQVLSMTNHIHRLDNKKVKIMKRLLSVIWIVTDSNAKFCHQCVSSSKIVKQIKDLLSSLTCTEREKSEMVLFLVKFSLGCLHNFLRHISSSSLLFRENNFPSILEKILKKYNVEQMIKAKTLIVLSYVVHEEEIGVLGTEPDVIQFIIEILNNAHASSDRISRKFGMGVTEVLSGINNLARNDDNKRRLVASQITITFLKILQARHNDEENMLVLTGIWRLSFLSENCKHIVKEEGLLKVLKELRFDDNESLRHSAAGALWELEQHGNEVSIKEENCSHIMISYQWDSQPITVKMKDYLKDAGYKVWMDVENISGSTLDAMSLAVENAALVLICMSQKYKDSPNCRSEAEYTYKLRKSFIPLRLEADYNPKGWLGMLIGTRLYFDLSSTEALTANMQKLVKEIGNRGKLSTDVWDGKQSTCLLTETSVASSWTKEEVSTWVKNIDLLQASESIYQIDGAMLMELWQIQHSAPEAFFILLRSDFKLSTIDLIKFSNAIRKLKRP